MTRVLITGANRGIGLGLARHYICDGAEVIATARRPSDAKELKALKGPGKLRVEALDVASEKSVAALKAELAGAPIDILINNAGIAGHHNQGTDDIDYADWIKVFETNVQGPVRVAAALLDNVKATRGKILTISSGMGSISTVSGDWLLIYAYRTSKSAVNMAMKILSQQVAKAGVTVAMLSPGWVKTDMGGESAPITVEQSAAGLTRVIANLTPEQNGAFLNFDGKPMPW